MKQLIKNLWAPKSLLLIAVLYTIALTILLLIPTQDLPTDRFKNTDKVFHVAFTMLLSIVWLLSAFSYFKTKFSSKTVLIIGILIFLYGIIIEVLQSELTNTRSADVLDVFANTVGLFIGIIVFYKLLKSYLKT
jgi:VanZ family protein